MKPLAFRGKRDYNNYNGSLSALTEGSQSLIIRGRGNRAKTIKN